MKENKKIEKFISKANLNKVLGELLKDAHLVAPVEVCGDIVFQEVESVNDIVFEYENCLNSPKDYLLLNDEPLFKYDLDSAPSTSKRICLSRKNETKVVLFGSRACDTKAVGLLDKFFSRNFKDPLYFNKRENILIITLVCRKLGSNCFCTSVDSGPYLESGFDIQLIDIGDGYFLEADSSKGKAFVKRFSKLITAIDADRKSSRKKALKKAAGSKAQDFNLEKVYANLNSLNTKDELWQDLSQRCQSCGGCLLLCPTCSCFYVVDKKINAHQGRRQNDRRQEGRRVRSLDTCFYQGLTRMNAGYNPVSPKEVMMRRKFYHKLWQQLDEFGEAGCTGCGRCNEICPGNINWLKVIKRIEKKGV